MRGPLLCLCLAICSAPLLTGQPYISYRSVLNGASYVAAGLPGGSIAQGSIFSIFGSNLGPASSPALSFPLSSALGGVSISVSAPGGTPVAAIPLYVSATQINAIMPSTAPLGAASVVVTFNGRAGNPAPVQIVNASFGVFTANQTGYGPGIATNFNSAVSEPINTPTVAAKLGQAVTLWGTGLGPVPYADNIAPKPGNLPTQTEVFVGGQVATIAYSGRSPCCSAVDQIVFTVPQNAPTGCWVPIQVRTGGITVSNTITMAISADGSPCSDPANPYAKEILAGGKIGNFTLSRTVSPYTIVNPPPTIISVDTANVAFVDVAAGGFPFNAALSLPPSGSCTVIQRSGDFLTDAFPNPFIQKSLDAGPTLTLTGSGSRTVSLPAARSVEIGANLPGGQLTNSLFLNSGVIGFAGVGGGDVGAFKGSITVPAAITWTNQSQISTVNRNQPLAITWSGATAGQIVEITGTSTDLPTNSSARFICVAPAGSATFTVPSEILQVLPASRIVGKPLKGTLTVGAVGTSTFAATGLDFGIAAVSAFTSQPVLYQ
jgi:uncharacterized protein (TIGR03437 family)